MVHILIFCNQFSCHFWWDVDFWPLLQWYVDPCSSQSFPNESCAGVSWRNTAVTNKSNCLTYTVSSLFVRTSPLAVITVVGLLAVLMVSNSAESMSFSLTKNILALESTTIFLSSGSLAEAFGRTHYAGEKNVAFVLRFELVNMSSKIRSLALCTSLLSFSLFMGPVLKFHSVGTSLMSMFDIYFSKWWSFFVPDARVTWRGLSESNTLNCVQDFLHCVSPKLFRSFYLVVHQPWSEGTNTCLLTYNPFSFCKIGTWADANIHKAFACRYSSNNIHTVVEEWTHGCCCLGCFFLDTLLPRERAGSEGVAAVCSVFFAHDLGYRGGDCNGLLANTDVVLSTSNRYLFLLQRHSFPFDSLSLLLFQFFHAWRQSFENEVSDLFSSLPRFSTLDSWKPISSDESPCRTIPIHFFELILLTYPQSVQTFQVFFIGWKFWHR